MNRKQLIATGILMGIGMGGFIDGIIFHQILQTHSMLSGKIVLDSVVNIKTSMFWDGIFHLFTWIATFVSIRMMWLLLGRRDNSMSGRGFAGALLMGWGIFNLVEGGIDHHLFGIHHVIESLGLSLFDYVFLGSGLVFILIGYILVHKSYLPEPYRPEGKQEFNRKPLIMSGLLVGMGMGGMLEGIVFTQIFQLHSMLSGKLPPITIENLRVSMFWDGTYHMLMWILIALSLKILWEMSKNRSVPFLGDIFVGSAMLGLGALNIVEAIIDHHILSLHHVVERLGLSIYDYFFLGFSVLLFLFGHLMVFGDLEFKKSNIFTKEKG